MIFKQKGMIMMTTNITYQKGPCGLIPNGPLADLAKKASLEGGAAVTDYFSNGADIFNQLITYINNKDETIWETSFHTKTNLPFTYTSIDLDGQNLYLNIYLVPNHDDQQSDKFGELYQKGKEVQGQPMVATEFSYNNGTLYTAYHFITSDIPRYGFESLLLVNNLLIRPTRYGVRRAIQSKVDNIDEMVDQSADDIKTVANLQKSEILIDGTFDVLSDIMLPLGILGAVSFLVKDFLLHTTQHYVEIHNNTNYDLKWQDPYCGHGELVMGPRSGPNQKDKYAYVIPKIHEGNPQALFSKNIASYGIYQFQESKALYGVGWGMNAQLMDDGDKVIEYIVMAASCPYSGKNRINIALSSMSSKDFYNNHLGSSQEKHSVNTSNDASDIQVSISMDHLDDKQTIPNSDGKKGYFYRTVIYINQGNAG